MSTTGQSSYYMDFFVRQFGKESLEDMTSKINQAARSARDAKDAADLWGRALKIAGDSAGVTTRELNAQLKETARLQREAADETRKAAEEQAKLNRQRLESFLNAGGGSGGGGAGGGGDGGGGTSIVGRIGGRVVGAELGRLIGLPGGGFIGSQIAQGAGLTGAAAVGLGVGAAGLFAGYEIGKFILDTSKWAQEQRNLGREFGITSGEMATFSRSAEVLGVKVDGSLRSVSNLSKELIQGGTKAKDIAEALDSLGLKQETAFKNTGEATKDIIAALAKVPDVATASAKAVQLLGESGKDLAALAREFPDLSDKLKIQDDTIDKAARMRDIINEMGESLKGGFIEGLASIFGGLLPSQRNTSKKSLSQQFFPGYVGPLQQGGIFNITGDFPDVGGPQNPAAIKSRNLDFSRGVLRRIGGSPEDKYRETMEDIKRDQDKLLKGFVEDLTVTPGQFESGTRDLESRKSSAGEEKRQAEELRRQQEKFREFVKRPIESDVDALKVLGRLPVEFPKLVGTPQYESFRRFLFPIGVKGITEEARLMADHDTGRLTKEFESESQRRGKDAAQEESRKIRENEQAVRESVGLQIQEINVSGRFGSGTAAQNAAIASGTSRYGLTSSQINSLQLSQSLGAISGGLAPQRTELLSRAYASTVGAGMLQPGSGERERLEQQAKDALIELEVKEQDARTKGIEAISRFNDAIDKSAEAIRSEFSQGFSSVILGAQRGGGRGALGALRGFGEGQEAKILQNIGEKIWDSTIKGSAQSVGSHLPPWLVQGTIFENPQQKIQVAAEASKIDLDQILQILQSWNNKGGTGIPGVAGGTSPGAPHGTGIAAGLSALGIGGGGGLFGGSDSNNGVIFHGFPSATGSGPDNKYDPFSKKSIAADIAGGLLAYQGIRDITSGGGAKRVSGGISEILGGAALIDPEPVSKIILASAAVVSGIVSSVLGDPRKQRDDQIQKQIFTSQYQAPQALNLSVGGNGGFSDTDIYGNVRESSLSPYPVVSNSYLDVPRRTVVPGHTIDQFGGYSGTPSAGVYPSAPRGLPPIQVHVNAMDSKSIVDRSGDIADALHAALGQGGHSALVNTLAQHLGIRG